MIDISEADLIALAHKGYKADFVKALADHAEHVMADYGITSRLRTCHFWAQAAHECDGFKATREYASGKAYEGRKDLGNTHPGDGVRYKGRGIFQLTGRANYASMGKTLGLDLIAHPELAEGPEVALRVACEFWKSRGLNAFADKDDITTITKRINGGLNGFADRKSKLATAKRVWKDGEK
jgi:putative chitinase